MPKNPFKYLGPLDPVEDNIVLVPRQDYLTQVTNGIRNDLYWGIFGLRQIGKTTFLRQIKSTLPKDHHLYINFEVLPGKEVFYRYLIEEFKDQIPHKNPKEEIADSWNKCASSFDFITFLRQFKVKGNNKKVILLFDEVEGIPFLRDFLHMWRKVYHDRHQHKELYKYTVIITGSAELIKFTQGEGSPFNIAEYLYMNDFSKEESETLITAPLTKMNIKIDENAKEKLIFQTSGHPQLLQQSCSFLGETAMEGNGHIHLKDVDAAISNLFTNNTTINTLKSDIDQSEDLKQLVKDIFNGKLVKYVAHREFSIKGAGSIINDGKGHCTIRNEIYRKYLWDILNITDTNPRFQMIKQIGKGGMGVVYRAHDALLNRIVAVKKLNTDSIVNANALRRFYEEARTTAQLKHQNIVTLHDIKRIGCDLLIIMEFIDGNDYYSLIRKEGPQPLKEVLKVAKCLFSALDYAHKKEIVHRDIKPQNIMKGQGNEVKVVDFGIASLGEGINLEGTGYIIGSPYYMAPEQIKHESIDHRVDIYASGATLFHLLTGKIPFTGEHINEIWFKHLEEPVPPIRASRNDIPVELVDLVERCMEKEKENRFQSAKDALKQLKKIAKVVKDPDTDGDLTVRISTGSNPPG